MDAHVEHREMVSHDHVEFVSHLWQGKEKDSTNTYMHAHTHTHIFVLLLKGVGGSIMREEVKA